jgi:tetratricopeptide (TPR) repeat protein
MEQFASQRVLAHKAGKELMLAGQFQDALFAMKQAQEMYGPHISISLDIASCYYMVKDYVLFEKYTQVALRNFESVHTFLSPQTLMRACLCFGRLLEELGQFLEAMAFYTRGIEVEDGEQPVLFDLYGQKLRLKSFLGVRTDFSKDYMACEKAVSSGSSVVDLTHALMMADHFLGLPEVAFQRMNSCLALGKSSDQRLLVFDHIAEVLTASADLPLPAELRSMLQGLVARFDYFECDPFEQALSDLLEGTVEMTRTSNMSFIGALKYLHLAQNFSVRAADKEAASTKMVLLLQRTSPECRELLRERWFVGTGGGVGFEVGVGFEAGFGAGVGAAAGSGAGARAGVGTRLREVRVLMEPDQLALVFQGRTAVYDAESLTAKIVLIFLRARVERLSIEAALDQVYSEELTMAGSDRLRKVITRINADISGKLGLENAFQFRKTEIRCRLILIHG